MCFAPTKYGGIIKRMSKGFQLNFFKLRVVEDHS